MIAAGAPDLKADPEVNWRDEMGQELNKHDLFLQGLKEAIKARRIRVKRKETWLVNSFSAASSKRSTLSEKWWL